MPYDAPLQKICGLWTGMGVKGEFLKGNVRDAEIILPPGTKIFVFPNQRKRRDVDPDYFLSASMPHLKADIEDKYPEEGSEPEEKPTKF